MESRKTVSDKRRRKGALSRIRGFLKSALRGGPAATRPQIIWLSVRARLRAAGACARRRGVKGGHGHRAQGETVENAAQLPAGMFADCHFHLTCSFFLFSSPCQPPRTQRRSWSPRSPPLLSSHFQAEEMGLNGDTLSTKATSGEGRARPSAV